MGLNGERPSGPSAASEGRNCPRCGNAVRSVARFCDACGVPLVPDAAASTPLLGREVKYITILFADVVGSTEMIASVSPEEAESILAPAVAIMIRAVEAFGGVISNVLGDGVMALFGAPVSQEDHALRACCAALRMHEAAAGLARPTQLSIGIASGPTLLGTQNLAAAGSHPAVGATIHLAARLQALARPGTTLCANSTRDLAGQGVSLVPLGPRVVRGLGVQQNVYALTGVRHGDGRFNQAITRGLTPLAGRKRELKALSEHAGKVANDGSVAVSIVGDAGAGKSRLAWEFAESLKGSDWHFIQADAVSYGRDLPYQLIGLVLRSCFRISAQDDPATAGNRVRGAITEFGLDRASAMPLLSLLDLPLDDDLSFWERLDPLRRREMLSGSVRELLNRVAHNRPTLLLIEDLQWADEESLRILDFAPSADSRTFLLATQRSESPLAWRHRACHVIALAPLSGDSMDRMVQEAFPAITDGPLRQALIERAAGNPFFLEELARDFLASRFSQSDENDGRDRQIPPTVHAVVAARIDRLAHQEKRILVTASALGSSFRLGILRALHAGIEEPSFQACLSNLCEARMFVQTGHLNNEVNFSHALVQEVAYAAVPRAQRRKLHSQIVRAIKATDADHLEEQAETLAYHATLGEAWKDLLAAARAAGRRATSRSAYLSATRFFQQAIHACEQLPRSNRTLADEIDLRFELRTALFPTAGVEHSLANSTRAEELARKLGDQARLSWATGYVARDLQLVGRPRAAIEMAGRAIGLAGDDQKLIITARYFAALAGYSVGDYVTVAATLQELTTLLEASDPSAIAGSPGPAIVFFRAWLTWSLSRLGRFDQALTTAAEMRRLSAEFDLPLCQTLAQLSEGFAFAAAGRLPEAEEALRSSLALCEKWEFFAWATNIWSCLGHVLSGLGKFEEAFDLLDRAIKRTQSSGILVNHANELAWFAEAHRLAGAGPAAVRHARQAIDVARAHEETGNETLATVVLGEALADTGDYSESRSVLLRALELANELRMTPVVQRCRRQLAALESAAASVVVQSTEQACDG